MPWEVEFTDELERWWETRWYDRFVPLADRLYDQHLEELKRKGSINGP